MINVKSEKGFYYKDPNDYLNGKINDLHSMGYKAISVCIHNKFYDSCTSGWGSSGFKFYGSEKFHESKEEIEQALESIDLPFAFFVQKKKISPGKFDEEDYFKCSDVSRYLEIKRTYAGDYRTIVEQTRKQLEVIKREELPTYYVINCCFIGYSKTYHDVRDYEDKLIEQIHGLFSKEVYPNLRFLTNNISKSTSKIINGKSQTSISDLNGVQIKVGDEVYYSPYKGEICKSKIDSFTDVSVKMEDGWIGRIKDNYFLKA